MKKFTCSSFRFAAAEIVAENAQAAKDAYLAAHPELPEFAHITVEEDWTEEIAAAIELLKNPAAFARAYSGKPGCMCGCKGTYTDKSGGIKARATNAAKLLANWPEGVTRVWLPTETEEWVSFQTEEHDYCFYLVGSKAL